MAQNAATRLPSHYGKINALHRALFVLKCVILGTPNTKERNLGMTAKTVNYTEEMVSQLHTMYTELGNDGLDEIAQKLEKPVRSVRAKLVRDGLYVASPKSAAAKKDGPSKKDLLNSIEEIGFDPTGLEGATKEALVRVRGLIMDFKGASSNAN